MVTMTAERTKLIVESAEAVLGLHWFVARDYTAKDEGLEFEIITPGIKTKFELTDPRSRDHHLVSSTNYQKAFEQGQADIYRACEWGQIRRTYDNPNGPIVARRPAMVYCSISGFGNTGLYKDRPGYDVIVQGEAGIQDLTGAADGAPYKVGTSIADLVSGLNGSQAVLAALYASRATGRGQHVAVSMYEAVASLLTFNASIYYATGVSPKRRGNAHATIVPYETFEASDGWISLGVANDELWKRFCSVVERPELTDDPRFAKAADRVRNRDILVPLVKDIIRQRARDEWLPLMDAAGIPSGASHREPM